MQTTSEAPELTLRQKVQFVTGLLLMGALVLSAALYPVFQQRAQAEKERIALIEKEQAEATKKVEGAAPVKAKVAKKRKGKMKKIAIGQSGMADAVASSGGYTTGCAPYPGSVSNHWSIIKDGSPVATELSPGEWTFDSGNVSLPASEEAIGVFQVVETLDYIDHPCPDSDETNGSKFQQVWKFEGVCIEKITITAEKIN